LTDDGKGRLIRLMKMEKYDYDNYILAAKALIDDV
jgi:hypothetical protein